MCNLIGPFAVHITTVEEVQTSGMLGLDACSVLPLQHTYLIGADV